MDVTSDSSNYFYGGFDFFFEADNRSPTPDESAKLMTIESALDVAYVSKKHAYFQSGELNYYRATGDPIISTGYLHFRANFLRKRRLSYELFLQSSFDASRRLDSRHLAGVGIKYRFFDFDGFELDMGTGILNEYERWETFDAVSEVVNIDLWKSSTYIKSNLDVSESATLSFITFYQVGYDGDINAFRNRVSAELQLAFEITEHFSFVAEGMVHYEDKPVIDINKTVYGISNGVRYVF
ncbi:DUF481 domain-containing protein [Reichenbachiella sp. MSK19-1]|uniref:DUF481 domain-containing protein n=1 Tax=Reichenbachiella sp. MSK19-1 TaxID=1897631 RepID=UPI000EB93BF9|nr:DUF481 domain-containing protein [Reichenbachiella sp. MSK19-1]RJE74969.1 hypothetical protein BGP76_17780 [Reichenbachiella sp. MSK19-1]